MTTKQQPTEGWGVYGFTDRFRSNGFPARDHLFATKAEAEASLADASQWPGPGNGWVEFIPAKKGGQP